MYMFPSWLAVCIDGIWGTSGINRVCAVNVEATICWVLYVLEGIKSISCNLMVHEMASNQHNSDAHPDDGISISSLGTTGEDTLRGAAGLLLCSSGTAHTIPLGAAKEAGLGRFPVADRVGSAFPKNARLTVGCTQKRPGSFSDFTID